MNAEQFLDRLEQERLVQADLLANLRGQVKNSAKPVAAGTIAKLLVEKKLLTAEQIQPLLADAAVPSPPAGAPAKLKDPLDDILGLAPLDDDPKPPPPQPAKAVVQSQPAAATPAIGKPAKHSPAKPAAVEKLESLDALQSLDELEPLGDEDPLSAAVVPLDDLSSGGDLFGTSLGDPLAHPQATASVSTRSAAVAAPAHLPPGAQVIAAPTAAPAKPRTGLTLAILGALLALVAVGVTAAIALMPKPTGDPEFTAAEADYQARQYSAAVPKYAAFVDRFSYHPQIGAARVHYAWSRIQEAAGGRKDWATILPVAKQSLAETGNEPQLSELHPELAPFLTEMAIALAGEARAAKDPAAASARLAAARDALNLANDSRFVPGNLRDWQRLAEVQESLALIEHDAGGQSALDAAIAAIQAAIGSGELSTAYTARAELLANYPGLAGHGSLRGQMQQAAKAEAGRVQKIADLAQPAAAAEPAIEVFVQSPSTGGTVAIQSAAGAAWGIDTSNGKLLWRAPALGHLEPVLLPGGDALLVDSLRHELVRIAAASGSVAWRFPLDAPIDAAPVVMGQQVVVASRSGRVVALDAASGLPGAAVQLPQGIRAAPAVDSSASKLYVIAEAHHLYVLSANDLTCDAAIYCGHEAGVDVAPLLAGRRLLFVENRGASSVLYSLATAEDGAISGAPQQEPLSGVVASPAVALGAMIVVVTDRTTVIFDSPAAASARLRRVGEVPASAAGRYQSRYAFGAGERLWIAGAGLRQYEVRTSGDLLTQISASYPESSLFGPPRLLKTQITDVRQDPGEPVLTAFGLQAADLKPTWETPLVSPASSEAQP